MDKLERVAAGSEPNVKMPSPERAQDKFEVLNLANRMELEAALPADKVADRGVKGNGLASAISVVRAGD